jgi:hypothetical protein
MEIHGGARLVRDEGGVFFVAGDGPSPVVITTTPPVVVHPNEAPDLSMQPGEDDSPFAWPLDRVNRDTYDYERQYALGLFPPAKFWYANESGSGNPARGSHRFAGTIAEGGVAQYAGTQRAVGGMSLWVLVKPDFEDPMTGEHLPAPANYLIRRALKLGHL